MATPAELWQRFKADHLLHSELVAVIASKFSQARAPEPDVVEYGPEGGPAVIIRYRDEALISIEPGPSLDPEMVDLIESEIMQELDYEHDIVSRAFLFADIPVNGWWRYGDMFQIMPAPPEAPRPIMLMADHPFVLEFVIHESQVGSITWARREARLRQLRLVLNALLFYSIRPLQGQGRHWVHVFDREQPSYGPTVLADEGYTVDGFSLSAENFTNLDVSQAIVVEPDEDHYGRLGLRGGEDLSVPTSLQVLLDGFFRLSLDDRQAFERAAYWLAHSDEVWRLSKSAAFVALVQAIEVLVPPSSGEKCPTCHRNIGPGPTVLFMRFLDEHVPELDPGIRRTLYSVRSAISHGGRLLHSDFEPPSMALVPGQMEEWRLLDMARYPVQRVLIGWLSERSS